MKMTQVGGAVAGRIGRPATPKERGYQLVAENPEVLERVACNLFGYLHGWILDEEQQRWAALRESRRERYRVEALAAIREDRPPRLPGGGQARPDVSAQEHHA